MVLGRYLANGLSKPALSLDGNGAESWVMTKGCEVFTGEGRRGLE
jgi:hypothetical protein